MSTYNLIKPVVPVFIFILAVIATPVKAQNISEQVTVTAAFEPTIPDANKINIEPPDSEANIDLPKMTYSNEAEQMMVSLKPESIAPVKLVGEPLSKLYRNYVKAGFGSNTSPLLDIYAGSLRSEKHALGLHLKHFSSSGEIEGYPKTGNSLNLAEIYGQKFFTNHTLSADLGFRRNVVHHYGFLQEQFSDTNKVIYNFSDEDLKQRFARFNGAIGIASNYNNDDRLNHFAGISFKHIADLFETSETGFYFKGGADKKFELFDFTDHQTLGLTADVDFIRYKDSSLIQNNTLISLKPFIGTEFNEYSIKAGLNINFKFDTVSKAYLFPFVEGRLKIIEDALVVHAGITGDIKRIGFDELSDINPFVQSRLPLMYMREKFTFYAGLRARAGEYIDFTVHVKSSAVDNAWFFINDYSQIPYNRFTLIHDDGTLLKGRAEAQYHTAERIMVKAFAELEAWSLDSLEHAYHVPVLKFGIDGMYQIQNKIIARANITSHGQQYALGMSDEGLFTQETLKGFIDASLGFEYRYTKSLSFWINFNNITNSRYYLWNNYPSYKFNLMGGVTYSF
ncbi:MAG TPA: hypothetical protein VK212_00580 [Lentimicrobium sp.]|nr:hypothetical protein [Lentimicrobium sp.]